MTSPPIIERFPIGKRASVLFGIFQEIEVGVGGCCMEPFSLAYVRVFGRQVTYANGFYNRISVNLVTPLFDDRLISHAPSTGSSTSATRMRACADVGSPWRMAGSVAVCRADVVVSMNYLLIASLMTAQSPNAIRNRSSISFIRSLSSSPKTRNTSDLSSNANLCVRNTE